MADSMCGPSNALKNIQTHSSIDRTLHQDRLISQRAISQGLKSLSCSSMDCTETDFERFQHEPLPVDHMYAQQATTHSSSSGLLKSPLTSGWVSDFERLNFSSDNSQMQQNALFSQTKEAVEDIGDWHQDFLHQQHLRSENITPLRNEMMSYIGQIEIAAPVLNGVDGILSPNYDQLFPQQQSMGVFFDQDAFIREFDQVAESEIDSQLGAHQNKIEINQDASTNKSIQNIGPSVNDNIHLTQARIGADTIINENSSEENNTDSLSMTALRLLNSVNDEKNLKFRNSQFLELMRLFRDKKATIQGDQIVGEISGLERNDPYISVAGIEPDLLE